MIKVLFKKKSGMLVSFEASGHAESCDDGYDMVCSAVSSVSIAVANGITEVLKIKAPITVSDGFLHIDLRNLADNEIEKSQVLMQTLLLGLKSIEKEYGSYIRVFIEEV